MHGPRWLFALALGFASMSSAAAQEATPSRKPVVPGAEREIAVELRFAWLSEASLERLGERLAPMLPLKGRDGEATGWVGPVLAEKQVVELLTLLQGDRAAVVTQAPKITLVSGQQATVQVGEEHMFLTSIDVKAGEPIQPKQEKIFLGQRHTLQPTLDANGAVRLVVHMEFSELAGPVPLTPVQVPVPQTNGQAPFLQVYLQQPAVMRMSLEDTFKIPDRHTQVACVGRVLTEARSETNASVLAKVPYLSRLFRNVG
jgi:general secretion pathway protein D